MFTSKFSRDTDVGADYDRFPSAWENALPEFQLGILTEDLSRLVPGIIVLSMNSGAYVAEIVRSGINAVPKGQTEAAYSLDIRPHQTMMKVILPQAVRNILPALGNEFVTIIKDSSLLATIGVMELFNGAQTTSSTTYQSLSRRLLILRVIILW